MKTSVAEIRRNKSMTQMNLAVISGLSIRTIAAAESGERITFKTLSRLAKVFGVKVSDLANIDDITSDTQYLTHSVEQAI